MNNYSKNINLDIYVVTKAKKLTSGNSKEKD